MVKCRVHLSVLENNRHGTPSATLKPRNVPGQRRGGAPPDGPQGIPGRRTDGNLAALPASTRPGPSRPRPAQPGTGCFAVQHGYGVGTDARAAASASVLYDRQPSLSGIEKRPALVCCGGRHKVSDRHRRRITAGFRNVGHRIAAVSEKVLLCRERRPGSD